ncbi:Metalloprotease [Mycena vitilis]|nr:Metalloprotease [Mycena vitilis]
MFFLLLAALFLATAALAVAPSDTQNVLSVVISSNKGTVDSLGDLLITAAVTNGGGRDIKVLRYGTVFDADLPTRSFMVTRNGTTVPFTGMKLSLSLAGLSDAAYTTIPAGKTVTVVHNVSGLFNFASVGAGQFSFAPVTELQGLPPGYNISAGMNPKHDAVTVTSNIITVVVTRDVAPPERRQTVSRSTSYLCPNSKRRAFIDSSITEAIALAGAGKDYIGLYGPSDPLYIAYFGANPSTSVSSVLDGVANVRTSAASLKLKCDETEYCEPGVIAYADFEEKPPLINYCDEFFLSFPRTRALCRYWTEYTTGGISVHELTHAISDTYDQIYGCEESKRLSDPEKINNADSFNCFTAAAYKKTKC